MRNLHLLALFAFLTGCIAQAGDGELSSKPQRDRLLKGDDAKRAREFEDRVEQLKKAGEYGQALKVAEEALAFRVRLQGEDHWEVQPVRQEVLDLRRPLSAEDRRHLLEASELWRKSVHLRVDTGRFRESVAQVKAVKSTLERILGKKHPDYLGAIQSLVGLYTQLGDDEKAETLLKECLAGTVEVLGKKNLWYPLRLNYQANFHTRRNEYARAEALRLEAKSVYEEVAGKRYHHYYAQTLQSLAYGYRQQRAYAKAEPLLLEAGQILREVLAESHHFYTSVRMDLGTLYFEQQDYVRAEPVFQDAVRIERGIHPKTHPDLARSLRWLAAVYFAQRRYDKAEELYTEAIEIHQALGGARDLSYGNLCWERAILRASLGQFVKAEADLVDATGTYEWSRQRQASGIERAVIRAGHDSPYPLQVAMLVAMRKPGAAFRALEFDLARGLLDEQAVRRGASLSPAESDRLKALAGRRDALQPKIFNLATRTKLDAATQKELDLLTSERNRIEAEIVDLVTSVSRRDVADLAAVQASLPADAALVAWVDFDHAWGFKQHWGCVVRKTGEPHWEPLSGTGESGEWSKEDLRLRLDHFRAAAGWTADRPEGLAERLRRQRFAPLVKHLDGVRSLYVIPAHWMGYTPIELLVPEFTVSYVPSGTFLARRDSLPRPGSRNSVLAVGDPVFSDRPDPLPPGGLLVLDVEKGGASDGRLLPGDVLVTYAGRELTGLSALDEATEAHLKDAKIEVKVWREKDGEGTTLARNVKPGPLGITLAREPARDAILARRKAVTTAVASLRSARIDSKSGKRVPWPELPGTAVELDRLRKLFGEGATILARSDASGPRLDDLRAAGKLGEFRYLHFATHGVPSDRRAFESKLILAQDGLLTPRGKEFPRGELTAAQVLAGWKLNADLVTLSACQTAIGAYAAGDGNLGFAQAFLVAGSRSVCLSLWEVDDTATSLLMDRFYQNLLGKREGLSGPMTKADALQEAKAWLRELKVAEARKLSAEIRNGVSRGKGEPALPEVTLPAKEKNNPEDRPFAHPKYWAAFILVGDPN